MIPIVIDYIDDWAARIRSRLYTQFRNKVTWEGFVQLIARQAQDLEDAFQTLNTLLDIDNSEGVQLDLIGRIVGQPRLDADDATYRLYLRARVSANVSTGTPEELYRVFNALLGALGFAVTTSNIGIKAFKFRVKGVITRAQALVGLDFLHDSKEAGARGLLQWQESPTASLFTFDIGPGFGVGVFATALQA